MCLSVAWTRWDLRGWRTSWEVCCGGGGYGSGDGLWDCGTALVLSLKSPDLQLDFEEKNESAALEAETKALLWEEDTFLARAVAVFDSDTIERVLPPVPVQDRVLASVTSGAGSGGDGYLQHSAYRVNRSAGKDSEEVARRLKRAWEGVFERHNILR